MSHLSSESKKLIYFPSANFFPVFLPILTPLWLIFIYIILLGYLFLYFKQISSVSSILPSFTRIICIFSKPIVWLMIDLIESSKYLPVLYIEIITEKINFSVEVNFIFKKKSI